MRYRANMPRVCRTLVAMPQRSVSGRSGLGLKNRDLPQASMTRRNDVDVFLQSSPTFRKSLLRSLVYFSTEQHPESAESEALNSVVGNCPWSLNRIIRTNNALCFARIVLSRQAEQQRERDRSALGGKSRIIQNLQ